MVSPLNDVNYVTNLAQKK